MSGLPMSMLEEHDWRLLLRSIREGQCILLLGPGAAVDPQDPHGDPFPVRLALKLAEELQQAGKGTELVLPSDLAHVAQIYAQAMPRKRPGLELAVEDFYEPYRSQTTPLHRDLAALPFTLCLSTTPERFLLNAFAQTPGKAPMYSFYHYQPNPSRARERRFASLPEGSSEERPLIYDLYGSLDEVDSLVLSEHDLLDFLVNVTRESPPLHPYVTSRFSDRTTSFLFIGFGFRHWYIRILLHVLKAGGHNEPSLALEDAGFFNLPDQRQTVLFFQSGHFINFRHLPWQDFAHDLRQRFERQTRADRSVQLTVPDPPANAPVAFLCHENRDKPEAEHLATQLKDRGIKIWLDKQSLRGGDNWAKLIPHVIEKQTDYVVVLQSPRMLDKPESYFWREIHVALERQRGFGPDLRFVVPVLLESHPALPLRVLDELHTIDVHAPAAIDALAQAILEDWQHRQIIRDR
jgi:hypothetical protein